MESSDYEDDILAEKGAIGAKLRAYQRQLRERDYDLVISRNQCKRLEVDLRETQEDLQELEEETERKIAALTKELNSASRLSRTLRGKIQEQENIISLSRKEKARLQESLEKARESLLGANHKASSCLLDLKYHKNRAMALEVKSKAAKRAQTALQIEVEELQKMQQEIIYEMGKTRQSSPRDQLSSGDEAVRKLSKKGSDMVMRLGTFIRGKIPRRGNESRNVQSDATGSPRQSPGTHREDPFADDEDLDHEKARFSDSSEESPRKYEDLEAYLKSMGDGSRLRKFFKGKPLYFQSLALTQKDMARQDHVLNNIVRAKEKEIEHLIEELEMEKIRNKELMVQVEMERRRQKGGEVKSADESKLQAAKEDLNLSEKKFHQTIFEWSD